MNAVLAVAARTLLVLAISTHWMALAAAQAAYPTKPIKLITPYPPGGSTDTMSRYLATKLSESLGQPVIVENRPGGNTIIGTEALMRAPADGYTLMLTLSSHVIVPNLQSTPFDAIRDFTAVSALARSNFLMLTNPQVPATTLPAFIAYGKAHPGALNYASAGSGTVPHLAGEYLRVLTGIQMQHVPYKGGAPALADLMAGHVQMYFSPPSSSLAFIRADKLRALAVTGDKRVATLPDVPTFAEMGMPEFDLSTWYGMLAPAGTPKEIVDKLDTLLAEIIRRPESLKMLEAQGLDLYVLNARQFDGLMKADIAKYADIVKRAGVKIDN